MSLGATKSLSITIVSERDVYCYIYTRYSEKYVTEGYRTKQTCDVVTVHQSVYWYVVPLPLSSHFSLVPLWTKENCICRFQNFLPYRLFRHTHLRNYN